MQEMLKVPGGLALMSDRPEAMGKFFDRRSESYDQHMRENLTDFEDFYRAVAQPIPKSERPLEILDLGCGTGLELQAVFERSPEARITAVDLSPGMLAELERKYAVRSEQIEIICESYLEVELSEARYDLALSVMTMHHLLPDPKRTLYHKIFKSLKPGGLYIEGDYVVSQETSREMRSAYDELSEKHGAVGEGLYHLDLPLTLPIQKRLLLEAGFGAVREHWKQAEAVVLSAEKDHPKHRSRRRLGS